jgi:cation:H+ antiporter
MGVAPFVLGLALLVVGAEFVVGSPTRVATMLGVSPIVIGLTVVSVGTSAPELAVGIVAGIHGEGGLAVGNVAGTNVLNLLFILGPSALLRPLPLHLQIFKLELPAIVFAAGLMTALAWDEVLSSVDGMAMRLAAAFYTVRWLSFLSRAVHRNARRRSIARNTARKPSRHVARSGDLRRGMPCY